MGRAAALSARRALFALFFAAFAPRALAQEPRAPQERATKPATDFAPLPPRAPIAGVRLLETTSTIVFAAEGAKPHELLATFAFPARARLQLGPRSETGSEPRELRYRVGERIYTRGALEEGSRELTGAARLEVLRDLELRQALFLWPDGLEWKAEDGSLVAERGELGKLRARTTALDARPTRLELVDAQGKELLSVRELTWTEERGRTWPAKFELWRAGALSLRETVEKRDTTRTYVDSFFFPADRREGALVTDRMLGSVQDQDLPRFAARRVELPTGLDWKAARAEIDRLKGVWTEKLLPAGLALEPNTTVELSEKLEPRALLVRLSKEPAELPEGFQWTEKRPGRVVFVGGVEQIARVDLARLRDGLAAGAKLAPLYARIPAREGPVLVVQPWTKGG